MGGASVESFKKATEDYHETVADIIGKIEAAESRELVIAICAFGAVEVGRGIAIAAFASGLPIESVFDEARMVASIRRTAGEMLTELCGLTGGAA